jgi:hypothetical protein
MSWYAFDAVDDALAATRRFLLPFSFRRWLRLAVVVLFLGSGAGGFNVPTTGFQTGPGGLGGFPTEPGPGPGPGPAPDDPGFPAPGLDPGTTDALVPALFALLAVAVLLALIWTVVSPIVRFVLVDMLRTDEVRIRRWFRKRLGKGLRLLGFRVGLGLLVGVPIVVLGAAFLLLDFGSGVGIAGAALLALLAIPVFVVLGLVLGFTNQFVVPIMIAADAGVLDGWRRFWPVLRRNGWQFLLFLIVRWVLALGVGIAVLVATGVVGSVVVIGAGVVGLLVVGQFGGLAAALASTAGLTALAVVVLIAVGILIVVSLTFGVPVRSFLTSYELSVLGRAAPEFALLPETGDDGSEDDDSSTVGSDTSDGPASTDDGGAGDGNEFVWSNEDDADPADSEGHADDRRNDRPD